MPLPQVITRKSLEFWTRITETPFIVFNNNINFIRHSGEGTAVFEDLYEYMRSLKIILDRKPSVIYPGHGNIIEDPLPKIQYYIDHRNKREAQILAVLRENPSKIYTAMQLVEVIYVETPQELWPAAAFNVNHHLQKLTKEGRLTEQTPADGEIGWQFLNDVT